MNTEKKNPRKQLEKFSTIFTQLGLVLTLFIVFVALEHETKKDLVIVAPPYNEDFAETVFDFTRPKVIKIVETKVKEVEQPKKRKVVTPLVKPKVVKNDQKETVIVTPVKDNPVINKQTKVDKPIVPENNTTISINNVQNTPVFKGCEGLSEKENRICFEKKIQKHVQRYFNAELAQDVGLRSGKYRILTQFIIDKNGNVSDVKIRAPHKRLEKETNKVVNKIPQFTPGKQNNKAVKVKYTLPITFKVE